MTPEEPLVTVVMPAYEGAPFIVEAINSVQSQTMQDWELIIVDDCSPDNTVEIIREIAAYDARLVLICNEKNRGSCISRNIAMDAARGRFIAFLDQDDIWSPEKLELQTRFMLNNCEGVTFTAWRRMTPDGRHQGRLLFAPDRYGYRELHRNTGVTLSSCMIDTEMVGNPRFADTYPFTEYELYQSMFVRGIVARGLRADLLRYRVGAGAMSHNKLRMARMVWNNFRVKAKLPLLHATYCFCHYAVRASIRFIDGLDQSRTWSPTKNPQTDRLKI